MRATFRLRLCTSLLAFVAANSFAECYDVNGVIKSTPVLYSGEFDPESGCAFPYPLELLPNVCITSQLGDYLDIPGAEGKAVYLSITGSGNASFMGTSELTTVPVVSEAEPTTTFAYTPLVFPPLVPGSPFPEDDARWDLQSFTSQAILVTKFRGLRGTLYTKDSGVITRIGTPAGGFAGQIVKIVGGDGDFEDATGLIGVAGQEVGGEPGSAATYTGFFCLPD